MLPLSIVWFENLEEYLLWELMSLPHTSQRPAGSSREPYRKVAASFPQTKTRSQKTSFTGLPKTRCICLVDGSKVSFFTIRMYGLCLVGSKVCFFAIRVYGLCLVDGSMVSSFTIRVYGLLTARSEHCIRTVFEEARAPASAGAKCADAGRGGVERGAEPPPPSKP